MVAKSFIPRRLCLSVSLSLYIYTGLRVNTGVGVSGVSRVFSQKNRRS